jgi:hypothetical protein
MSKTEAARVVAGELRRYREMGYDALSSRLGQNEVYEVRAPSGTVYQIEVQVFLDGADSDDIRVLGAADGGGVGAFCPLCDDFIIRPDGTFVGE